MRKYKRTEREWCVYRASRGRQMAYCVADYTSADAARVDATARNLELLANDRRCGRLPAPDPFYFVGHRRHNPVPWLQVRNGGVPDDDDVVETEPAPTTVVESTVSLCERSASDGEIEER